MKYIFLIFFYFLGQGVYFSSLSPYILALHGPNSWLIFLAGQIAFPFGFFLAGFISDRFRNLRTLLVIGLLLHGPIQFYLFSPSVSLQITILLSGLARFLFATNFQLITIAILEGVGSERFGKVRSAGTVSFFLVQLLLYLVESNLLSINAVSLTSGELTRLTLFGQSGLVFHTITAVVALFIQKGRTSGERYFVGDAFKIVKRGEILLFFFLSFLFFSSYQLVDYYVGHYLHRSNGLTAVYGGWCLAVVLEIPFLNLTSRIVRRFSLRALFLLSTLAGALRFGWLTMGVAGIDVPAPFFSQLLHGIQFTGYYMGALLFLRREFPEHLFGTAYGIYMVFSVALGGMAGNVFFGRLLFSQSGRQPVPPFMSVTTEITSYFPLFFSALIVQFLLFFCFVFLPSPTKRDL